jgi:hypothetical protein
MVALSTFGRVRDQITGIKALRVIDDASKLEAKVFRVIEWREAPDLHTVSLRFHFAARTLLLRDCTFCAMHCTPSVLPRHTPSTILCTSAESSLRQ